MALRGWGAVVAVAAGILAGTAAASGGGGLAAMSGVGSDMAAWDGTGPAQEGEEAGQGGQVLRVAVSADAREVGAAFVSMNYQLELGTETRVVPFTLLLFAPASVGEISAQAGGVVLPLRMTEDGGPRLEGEIELPAGLAGSGPISLDLGYWVEDAVRSEGEGVRVVLPLLAIDWAPAEASPGTFEAEVTLPEGMEAREIFPVTPSGGAIPGVARASLQVVPAVVQVRARPEGSFGLSLPRVLELLVLIVVIACGMAGLRYVRRLR